ncbi:MAG: metallophosphoesterase, partial [Myxococcales bacterium]|nr:metallophosphoesterase [Myxococcales bacterium]
PVSAAEVPGSKPRPKPRKAHFVSLSDLHFDPFADPELVPQLIAAEPQQWRAIFAGAANRSPSGYHHDSNVYLLDAALKAVADRITTQGPGKPEFAIISGDFLGHHFREQFDELAPEEQRGDEAAYRRFAAKAVAFVTAELATTFGDLPVFPALGNNDSFCGDYHLTPGGEFLSTVAPLWQPLIERKNPAPDFAETFAAGGYYQVPSPSAPGTRIVVLNTNLFSSHYQNTCAEDDGSGEAIEAQFEWLSGVLAQARNADERVWLVYHVPPGVDVFATTRATAGECKDKIRSFWKPGPAAAFLHLLDEHADTIAGNFAGHIHTDDFRLLISEGQPRELIHFTPAISPLFGNNPAFQIFDFESRDG